MIIEIVVTTLLRRYAVRVGFASLFAGVAVLAIPNLPTQIAPLRDWGKFSTRARTASETKRHEIERELISLGAHPWAGSYHYGDGLGVNVDVSLAPRSGFVFTWHGCLGLYDLNYGGIVEDNGRVHLNFKFPNERRGFRGIAAELVPVRWGERHYLVPSDGFVEFANDINAGFETGRNFLLRVGDEEKPVHGLPEIPAAYSAYLLSRPIDAQILGIKEAKTEGSDHTIVAVVDAGSTKGLLRGMTFHVYSPSDYYESGRVISVSASRSEVKFVDEPTDCRRSPSVGWKVSTSAQRRDEPRVFGPAA